MTLIEIRRKAVQLSGRYDLVQDRNSWADNGMDWFIQQAQRWLDDRVDTANARGELSYTIEAGAYRQVVQNARAILSVAVRTSAGYRKLKKESLEELRERLTGEDNDLGNVDPGTPSYYAIGTLRGGLSPTQSDESDIQLVLYPPAEEESTLLVTALLRSNALTSDGSYSWWSVMYPGVLVRATLHQLETFYRNTEGARDYLNTLLEDLAGIDHNAVSQDVAEIDQMRDSW